MYNSLMQKISMKLSSRKMRKWMWENYELKMKNRKKIKTT